MSAQDQRRQSARLNPATVSPPEPQPNHRRPRGSQKHNKTQRVNEICQFMTKKRITLGEFIQIYATTEGSGGLGERPATRVKRLADAIYGQPEILDALREHPASGAAGIVTVRALRKEMEALELAGEIFCNTPPEPRTTSHGV